MIEDTVGIYTDFEDVIWDHLDTKNVTEQHIIDTINSLEKQVISVMEKDISRLDREIRDLRKIIKELI